MEGPADVPKSGIEHLFGRQFNECFIMLPPLVLNVFGMGLVGGKIESGKTSDGFLHACLLLLMTFIALCLSPYYSIGITVPGVG